MTPFAHDHGVSKSISKLDTIQPKTVKSIETSSAKAFFSSLADAICDICHNIVAFCSQSDETILSIGKPVMNMVQQLRENSSQIKNALKNNTEHAKMLREGRKNIKNAISTLQGKLNNDNKHDFNLAGDGRKALLETLAALYEARILLSYGIKDETENAIDDLKSFMQSFKNNVRDGAKVFQNDLKIFQDNLKTRIAQEIKSFQEVGKELKEDAKQFFNDFGKWISENVDEAKNLFSGK
ncbi:MAG: hypothetical protein IJ793_01885 [Opitutales bacterium]|nr:hypothetical protein [Opitutales bacterium]